MKRKTSLREIDYGTRGYETMRHTRNEALAKQICGLELQALDDDVRPDIMQCEAEIKDKKEAGQAGCDQLYKRHEPVVDAQMFARWIGVVVFGVMSVVALLASAMSHTLTFAMFGWSLLVSAIVGVTLTAVAASVGHQVFERILRAHAWLHAVVAVAGFALCFWGLIQLAQARGLMTGIVTQKHEAASFVDDVPTETPSTDSDGKPTESLQQRVQDLLGSAIVRIMLAADIMVGLFLGLMTTLYSDPDFVLWRHVRKLKRQIARLQTRVDQLRALVQTAAKECAAGILRGRHFQATAGPTPYLKMLPIVILVALLTPTLARAQSDIRRQEVVLLDTSGSIGKNTQTSTLFREYLIGAKRLLETEPPQSRVWVQLVTTDSFGAVQTLLKGWTPAAQGIFTDDLARARRQLVSTFQSKTGEMRPIASGTDITGGLWRAKAAVESGSGGMSAKSMAKEFYIFSDMMNETHQFNMPALLPTGTEKLIEYVKANGLLVPLTGYTIRVVGASTAGMNPETWNAVKRFWTAYFRAAGADLLMYSSEVTIERD